jgi:predicted enzyme related to lactoylglutathione lyase
MAKTLGIGGVFFRADDPQLLAEWYATWLGFALRQVKEGGAIVTEDVREHEYGLFGWFVDPQGNKVELWEPRAPE